jgi:plastocyanin
VTIEKPPGAGYVTRVKPDLVDASGQAPPIEQVHMHHAVMLNLSARDSTYPSLPQRFYGFAEEKTIAQLPARYGYPVKASDVWGINYMLHNETPETKEVWVQYDVDWVPAGTPTAKRMRPARPLWIDVQNGKAYPVFDALYGQGGDGRLTYPDEVVPSPYGRGPRLNEWRVDRPGTLVAAAGHLHPGGLRVDLDVVRAGRRAHVFRSNAKYFDPNGPVSWDLAMTKTPLSWRAGVRKGDELRVSTTYDTTRASWYENMGILGMYAVDGIAGPDPFSTKVDAPGAPTHGPLPEDSHYGGQPTNTADPAKLAGGAAPQNGVAIANFIYMPGDLSASGSFQLPPVVDPGQSLTFTNLDAGASIPHTVTACKAPCNRSTGISYPLANGPHQFDSGQLDYGPPAGTAAGQKTSWSTPSNLPPGTYTYFCRVHPFMRGAFRVAGTPPAEVSAKSRGASSNITILSKSLRMDRRGRVPVRLRCNAKSGKCSGVLQLATTNGRKTLVLGKARFAVRAGHAARVRVKLKRAKSRLVNRKRRMAVIARATPGGGGASASATLVLRAPKRR